MFSQDDLRGRHCWVEPSLDTERKSTGSDKGDRAGCEHSSNVRADRHVVFSGSWLSDRENKLRSIPRLQEQDPLTALTTLISHCSCIQTQNW